VLAAIREFRSSPRARTRDEEDGLFI